MTISGKKKILLVTVLLVFGLASRFLPHASNFTPLSAIALFVSAYLGVRYSLAAVLAIMFVSDLFIGFYSWPILLAVYGSFIYTSIVGFSIKKKTVRTVFVATVSSSLIFYLITNWAVWQFGTMYDHSLVGLMQSYMMAVPFFRNALLGDILYSGLLFGAYELAVRTSQRVVGHTSHTPSDTSRC